MDSLSKRYECDSYGNCYNNTWDSWARWVVLAVVIVGALVLFFLFSCISARRRRKMGYAPYRGTGWAVGGQPPPGQFQQPYYASNYQQPPPAYGQNQGYYAPQRETDVEMQPPQNVYNTPYGVPNQGVYSPPPGAPPSKGNAIVR